MIRPRAGFLASVVPISMAILFGSPTAHAFQPRSAGQFFTITEPISQESINQIKAATRQLVDRAAAAEQGEPPVLVFEFRGGKVAPGTSAFGTSYDLATLISKELAGAKVTVAYVPEPIQGYAVLPILACTEIIMGSDSSIGPITAEGQTYAPELRGLVQALANRKVRSPELLLGMFDRDADLRLVRTADKHSHYVFGENLPEFQKSHSVVENRPAWEGGRRGVLTAARAKQEGFCKRIADSRDEVAGIYQLSGRSAVNDPTLGQALRPVWIKIDGPLDSVKSSYLSRRIAQAEQENANLIFFQIDSEGGVDTIADGIADMIAGIKGMKTVAFIDDRALGVSALLPLACRDIVFAKQSRMGDVRQLVTGRGNIESLTPPQVAALTKKAVFLAREKGHPEALAAAMVDPTAEVVEARDFKTGSARLVLRTDIDQDRDRYEAGRTVKEPGPVLTVTGENAPSLGLGQSVTSADELKGLYNLQGQDIRVDGPSWTDTLVTFLTDPFVSWILLFIGMFMLVIELKLPGIGLPGITSALAFLVFFWSHYLSGTADQLEIILFLVGLVCLALELFVFPGFGIFGLSGILLMLGSIVMASHTFIWPSQEYEYREMGYTLIQMSVALTAVGAGAMVVARYLPSMPLFNRLILKPEPWLGGEFEHEPQGSAYEGYESLGFLLGEFGRTTSPLRPMGKAKFGEHIIDVTADRGFIEPDSLVEVIDVQGTRVVVKPAEV
jgi:membrane-bound serine protease (ClpP class)